MKDILAMVDGTTLYNVHTADRCAGQPCCIHNPTKHHMADWKPRWDDDWKQLWRVCPHGFNHPDPDDAAYLRRKADATARMWHGCDGCCQPPLRVQAAKVCERPDRCVGCTGPTCTKGERFALDHKPQGG